MENQNDKDFEIMAKAGSAVEEVDGKKVEDSDFVLVQQDKTIHDTKFTTKPTTFFKDAMRRFSKNRSSVVGGIILGVLFLLAIILPIDQVISYDVTNTHNYETHLPAKLFPAGTGFWDGTRTISNQAYPYDSDGNYIGLGYDDSCVVKISNIHQGYGSGYSSDASGGFVQLYSDQTETEEIRYMYSYYYAYDFSDTYNISFTLGSTEGQDLPDYSILFVRRSDTTFFELNRTSDYGAITNDNLEEGQSIYTHETQTVNLTELIENNETLGASLASNSTITGYVGILFHTSTENSRNFYVKDFVISNENASSSESRALSARSFTDANEMTGRAQYSSGTTANQGYWAKRSDTSAIPVDVITTRCSITYDYYQITYGLRSGWTVAKSVMDNWVKLGYIEWDENNPLGGFTITEAGEAANTVYVRSVDGYNAITLPDGTASYTYTCTIMMWQQLGYSSMPVHILGTEMHGRDILKYVFSGLRTSLILGFIVSIINIIIGIVWGSISGYFGGTVDLVMERIVDVLSGIPWIILMTVLTLQLGSNFFVFALSLCLTGWIGTEAITRSQFYRYRDREYVLAAKTLGAKSPRLIFRHILPNALGTIVTSSILMIPSVIFSEATISFLGLGLTNLASLGVILSDAQNYLSSYPIELIVPAVIISLLMICFNLFGNGLRDAFNPSLKGTE